MHGFDPVTEDIDEWIEELQDFMLTHHGQCDDRRLLSALKTLIGEEGRMVIRNMTPEMKRTWQCTLQGLFECIVILPRI